MRLMNRFLESLQTEETKAIKSATVAGDDERGIITTLDGGKRWRNDGEPLANDGFTVVNGDVTTVNSGKWISRRGEKIEINTENRWKINGYDWSDRPISKNMCLLVGVVVATALFTTIREYGAEVQATAYLLAIGLFAGVDPFNLISRILANKSRWLVCFALTSYAVTIWSYHEGINRACYIAIACAGVLVIALNSFWIKAEHFLLSPAVEKGLHGDKDNRGGDVWRAVGRRAVWGALDTIGVIAKAEDIDTVFKLVFLVGFWECYDFQNDQSKALEDLRIELLAERATTEQTIAEAKAELEAENEKLIAEYNALVLEFNELEEERDELADELEAIREEETNRLDPDEEEDEIIPDLPSWATIETYKQVIALYDENEPKRNIERITGVSRYKIDQLIALRDEAVAGDDYSEKVVAFG